MFPSKTVISIRLPDSASVFTAEVWAIIKSLEQINIFTASKYIVFTDSLSCLQALHHMKLEHFLIEMVIRKSVFLNIVKKDLTLLASLHWICLVPRLVYHTPILNIVSANIIIFHLARWLERCGREQASFCQASHGRLAVLLHYRRCRKDEVVLCRARIGHTHLTHSYILRKDPPPQCEHCRCILTVRHNLVECNHFARERKDAFGRRDVMKSFRFHPTLILLFLKQIEFYYKF